MLKTLSSKKNKGFTLVEIMIVVAIIALLASIAVPNFMRARSRSQATAILEEVRLIEAAKDQWAIETNQGDGAAEPTWAALKPYLKTGSRLEQATSATDILGGTITVGTVGTPVKVSAGTVAAFTALYVTPVTANSFWGSAHP